MGEVNVISALERIEGSTIKERSEGLADLRHILRHNQRNPKKGVLKDAAFHKIFETVFRVASNERSTYLKSLTSAAKNVKAASSSRLSSCAQALRLAVEFGVRNIRLKTLKALLDHILETLPDARGNFCEPLALDYAKCLNEILAHQPHVEHLPRALWEQVCDFCLDAVQSATVNNEIDASPGASGVSDGMAITGLSMRSSRSGYQTSQSAATGRSSQKLIVEEFLSCLRHLTAPPSAPVVSRARRIFSSLISHLSAAQSLSKSHQDAVAAIHQTLIQTRTEAVQLTRTSTVDLLRMTRGLWGHKYVPAKDELLIMLVLLHPYVMQGIKADNASRLRAELASLLEVMRTEYSRRSEKDQLHLEDLELRLAGERQNISLECSTFALRDGVAKAEHPWTVMQLIAFFHSIVGSDSLEAAHGSVEDDGIRSRKRMRLQHWSDELLRMIHDPQASARVCALQVIAATLQRSGINEDLMQSLIESLYPLIGEDRGTESSWVLLALTSCATQKVAKSKKLTQLWNSVWQIALRTVTTASSCRAGCHLVNVMIHARLVDRSQLLDVMEIILSAPEVNGPSLFCDSVSSFLQTLVIRNRSERASSAADASERILTWLFHKWTPSNFNDRVYTAQHAHTRSKDVLDLISACLNRRTNLTEGRPFQVWGPVAQSFLLHERQHGTIEYLLLLQADCVPFQIDLQSDDKSEYLVSQSGGITQSNTLVIALCTNETARAVEQWQQAISQRSGSITSDVMRVLCTLTAVGHCLAHYLLPRESGRIAQLQTNNKSLLELLLAHISNKDCEQDRVDAVLDTLVQLEPHDANGIYSRPYTAHLSARLSRALDSRLDSKQFESLDQDEDMMDFDPDFDSQKSQARAATGDDATARREVSASYDITARRAGAMAYARLARNLIKAEEENEGDEDTASSTFIDYVLSLPLQDFFAAHTVLTNLSSLGLKLSADSVDRLFGFFADSVLSNYEYERSEIATGMILDLMSNMVDIWTNPANEDLYALGEDMYNWYTGTALSAELLSMNVQKRMADLMLRIMRANPDYGKTNALPSPRTKLLQLLKQGSLVVKYEVTEEIPNFFKLFTLSVHSEIFDDVRRSLPIDVEWVESMAVRVLMLSRLGSVWPSLLRQCVYYIFETAGISSDSGPYAEHCLMELARKLAFNNPQEIFVLFSPQLLYTWLESHALQELPFSIFGYKTLSDLLRQNQTELFAQLISRDKLQDAEWLSEMLAMKTAELLDNSFTRSVAYAISWDICAPSSTEDKNPCENRLRNLMISKDEYKRTISRRFPSIAAKMFLSMNYQDDGIEKALDKRPNYAGIASALREMRGFSSSNRALPESQEPSFKGKYFLDQMERLARRIGREVRDVFDTRAFTACARLLLDNMHIALGPLYACQIIRKLRLLIAIAGDTALSGYPLEMLIHALRPFAVNAQCADDTIGILSYLYNRGVPYLTENIPTMAGHGLLTLLSMKSFMTSRQERTTQESQFRSTVSIMQSFHDTLANQLLQCQQSVHEEERSRYLSIVQSCRDLTLPGTAIKNQPGSMMLCELLNDEEASRPVLGHVHRKEMLSLMRLHFRAPQTSSDDVFGDDELSAQYAARVWNSLQNSVTDEKHGEYITWAGSVLGRAYGSTGALELVNNIRHRNARTTCATGSTQSQASSKSAIVGRTQDLLLSDRESYVGLGERTLRTVMTRFSDAQEAVEFEQLLPAPITAALLDPDSAGLRPTETPKNGTGRTMDSGSLMGAAQAPFDVVYEDWVVSLAVTISQWADGDPIVGSLAEALRTVKGLATDMFPFILHLTLARESGREQVVRTVISEACRFHFESRAECPRRCTLLLESIIYLLTQPYPQERTRVDRLRWLDVDYLLAAETAADCGMPTTALLFAESTTQPAQTGRAPRRSSAAALTAKTPSNSLLLTIFKMVDDPDSFYGVKQPPSLRSVLGRVDHEGDGLKGLMLHSARMDALIRSSAVDDTSASAGVLRSLGTMNLNSLTSNLLSTKRIDSADQTVTHTMLEAARKLERWDVAVPQPNQDPTSTLYQTFQTLRDTNTIQSMKGFLDHAMASTVCRLQDSNQNAASIRSSLSAITVLTEISEVTSIQDTAQLGQLWESMQSRQRGWDIGRYDDARQIISYRETIFSTLSRNKPLQETLCLSLRDCRALEVQALINTSSFSRKHGMIQHALTAATYLSELVPVCYEIGLKTNAAAQFEVASILWKQDEVASSVQMLQELCFETDLRNQSIPVEYAGMLAQLGNQIATARLEKPEDVIARYLKPAVEQLTKASPGSEAGKVFHAFASFCDEQLQNPGSTEDFNRLTKLRASKLDEVQALENLMKASPSNSRQRNNQTLTRELSRQKQWYKLDDEEYMRAKKSRDEFVQQSLQNYLRALYACDDYDASVVRFFALWLEHSDSEAANAAVKSYLDRVPSWKFVVLMNQQMSRLLYDGSPFQSSLTRLVARICTDHPYHSIHHIFASCQTKINQGDEITKSRVSAAKRIENHLRADKRVGKICDSVWTASRYYQDLAMAKIEAKRAGKISVRSVPVADKMEKRVSQLHVPPATLNLELRPDRNYDSVPEIVRFRPDMSIATGLSAPKILTAIGSDGREYRQLFKGGNDDLRQDAIMEQVFEEVSKMLRNHRETRQRNLQIRTYKVLPLSNTSGIIEFVPNSIPFDDFVRPAHARYHPGDIKTAQARDEIRNAMNQSKETRIKVYRAVTDRYTPVLRHFFLEHFPDPDEWFERRLAYTRTSAAISMLGHVLGLGDRHCHNILLDEKSGEVIHIDLGVAFEAGRVLPVPEVVPFRLTRDVVDGMGVTKTEGVFRRCCEFTMEALRDDKDSIMTLLNVLRYDPLYNWTVSPLRAKRIQEAQEAEAEREVSTTASESKKKEGEAGEAERALAVVEKKLSKTLSTAATVNELIQQATDERNLALLFAGWAAFQ